LRVRWEWLRQTDQNRPWQGLPLLHDPDASAVFNNLVTIITGKGDKVWFWKDRWMGGRNAEEIAPSITAKVSTHRKNTRTVEQPLHGNRWLQDMQVITSEEEEQQCIQLWTAIQRANDRRNHLAEDEFCWSWSRSGVYSASSTYRILCEGQFLFAPAEQIWRSLAPLKAKIFAWLAVQHHLWTSDRRFRHGLQDSTATCFVHLQEDMVEHVLVQCSFARQVWFRCFQELHLSIDTLTHTDTFKHWWTGQRRRV
jgi:hypothetical protein